MPQILSASLILVHPLSPCLGSFFGLLLLHDVVDAIFCVDKQGGTLCMLNVRDALVVFNVFCHASMLHCI